MRTFKLSDNSIIHVSMDGECITNDMIDHMIVKTTIYKYHTFVTDAYLHSDIKAITGKEIMDELNI